MLWSSTLRCFRFWSIGACVLHFKSVMIDLIKPHRFLSWVGIPYTPLSCAVALFRTQLSHFIMWNLLRVGKLRFSDKIDCMNFDHHTTKATGMWRSFARKLYRADICTCAISWFRHHSIRLGLAQHCTRSCLSITSSLSSFIVLCLSWGSPFFMRSASISSIGQYSTLIAPFSTWSQLKRSWTSTCFVFAVWDSSQVRWRPGWQKETMVGAYFDIPRSHRRYWSHISSFSGPHILLQLSIEQPWFASLFAN